MKYSSYKLFLSILCFYKKNQCLVPINGLYVKFLAQISF